MPLLFLCYSTRTTAEYKTGVMGRSFTIQSFVPSSVKFMQVQYGFIRHKERYLDSLNISDCQNKRSNGKERQFSTCVLKLGTFLRGPLLNKNVLQNQAKRSRIWGEFPQFRLLGLGLILRHRIILLIQFLGLPDCNFMYHQVMRV